MEKLREIAAKDSATKQTDRDSSPRAQAGLIPSGVKLKRAASCFKRFRRISRMAFLIYAAFLLILAGSYFTEPGWASSTLIFLSFAGFLSLLFLSFFSQSDFYNAIGKTDRSENPLILLFLGMPMYILVYFHLEKLMKDELHTALREFQRRDPRI